MRTSTAILACLLLLTSCSQPAPETKSDEKSTAPAAASAPVTVPSIDGNAMKTHTQKLSSDEMEGRAPGGKGEELATAYISDFYKSIGLKTQFQAVPMVGITSTATPLKLSGKGGSRTLKYADEFVAWS